MRGGKGRQRGDERSERKSDGERESKTKYTHRGCEDEMSGGKHTPVEPHGQDVSSLTYTHRSYADRSPCALAPSLSGGVQRGPGRPQRSALAIWSTLGLGGYWIPLPWPAGWVARLSAALFSSPA
ncbi:hypothetical protein Q8A67_023589 [Cirrhinus molitorella]|uniref:Uncharacterized protein n=1 Tax=Cirrhinus molitorella TaxID=172907 RepID=A0AA88PE63_9TELE|nr:hypothetical protein Q8A67_023589 [Cirrhinus molitorella]